MTISYVTSWGRSKYESLQAHIKKRYSSGLTFGDSYTYAMFLSDAVNPNGGGNSNSQNDYCIACNWGPTPDDYKHVLSINHVYELPFWAGTEIPDARLSVLSSGRVERKQDLERLQRQPVCRFSVGKLSNASGGGTQRPNRIANGALPSNQRNYKDWFNLNTFVAPAQYTYGNSGMEILVGPGYFDSDLGVFRSSPIRERSKLTFRAESFNTFNNVNFGIPNSTIGTAVAGALRRGRRRHSLDRIGGRQGSA